MVLGFVRTAADKYACCNIFEKILRVGPMSSDNEVPFGPVELKEVRHHRGREKMHHNPKSQANQRPELVRNFKARTRAGKWAALVAIIFAARSIQSCGVSQPSNGDSDLMWVQSRTDSSRYAYLEDRDLQDTFIFGASAINTSSFLSSALDTTLGPKNARLVLRGDKLQVVPLDGSSQTLMSFDVKKVGDRYEVDFASSGNDLTLRSLIDIYGGMNTSKQPDGFWASEGAPKVLKVQQDADNVVVDLEHTVTQASRDASGTRYYVTSDAKPGKVVLRIFLTRKNSLPKPDGGRTVAEGARAGFGFFGADTLSVATLATDRQPVQRIDTSRGPITIYLKDVPEKYQDMAKRAVLSWNGAFGKEILKVAIAPATLDAGDPRYHVVRWYDGTDETIQWAGIAHMIVEPDTGLVMGGSVYVMGNKLEEIYQGIVQYSAQAAARAEMSLGNVRFVGRDGETPVIPFLTDTTQSFEEYMMGYYEETITHEIGHYLGLRHNFAGSTLVDNQGLGASIMDYAPRKERSRTAGPGVYDAAAIRWSYHGEYPQTTLPFCTDEDLTTRWDCNHSDFGHPVAYTENGIINGIRLLTSTPVPIEKNTWISPLGTLIGNALKISRLLHQLPESDQVSASIKLRNALNEVRYATPDKSLPVTDQLVIQSNLKKLQQVIIEENGG